MGAWHSKPGGVNDLRTVSFIEPFEVFPFSNPTYSNMRRSFLKKSAALAAFFGLHKSGFSLSEMETQLERLDDIPVSSGKPVFQLKVPPINPVKVGLIGLGNRGLEHLRLFNLIDQDKVRIQAICDIRADKTSEGLEFLNANGTQRPATYQGSPDAWRALTRRDDIDLIVISTPWEDHVSMSLYGLEQGKHIACEVPFAYTLDDCWALIDAAEAAQRHCFMLENVCYGEEELWLLNMAMQGFFGTLTYAECAYIHDLRELLFSQNYYYNQWRLRHNLERDGNLYPTHGLGPVAQYMGIHRGDTFDFLVSMSSRQTGLDEAAKATGTDSEFYNKTGFRHGDINNTLIKTAKSRTILLQHDVVTSRPYSRINMLAGTKAFHTGYPSRISIDGKGHGFLKEKDHQELKEAYRHPLWQKLNDTAKRHGGHGGMDFIMLYRLIDCLNRGLPLDMDVYDGVAWSVVTPLSAVSCELGSIPVRFPDLTRGQWKEQRMPGVMSNW